MFGILYVIALVFQDFYRKKFYVLKQSRTVLAVTVLVVAFQFAGVGLFYYLDILSLELLLAALSVPQFIVLLVCLMKYSVLKPSFSMITEYWAFGKWLFYNALLQWFSGNLVITVGVYFLGSFVAGIVRLAQNINGVVSLLYQVVENVVPSKACLLYTSPSPRDA